MRVAIVGAGWAGLAAAVTVTAAGHHATVFEAAHAVGGRARAVNDTLPDGTPVTLDNGQHILIGAYTETLRLMAQVGMHEPECLLRVPLTLQFPDGDGLRLPRWPAPLDALGGIAMARGWTLADKWALLRAATGWQLGGFRCDAGTSVAQLCCGLPARVMETMIEPLCVSALNTPAPRASGQVFLRVLRDALFGGTGSSNLLLPTIDLGRLFPQAAVPWLEQQGSTVLLDQRVTSLLWGGNSSTHTSTEPPVWRVNGTLVDAVVWATSASNAALALAQQAQAAPDFIADALRAWAAVTEQLQHEAIATVYAFAPGLCLPQPMLALRCDAEHPAQFVFDRGQLGGPAGLLAFVVSASNQDRVTLQRQVLHQADLQLGALLQERTLIPLQTIVEKRATFACLPGLVRPPQIIAPGLLACGDYVDGPYPATLEGAVRSGVAAAGLLMPA